LGFTRRNDDGLVGYKNGMVGDLLKFGTVRCISGNNKKFKLGGIVNIPGIITSFVQNLGNLSCKKS
jgi:hypothetical protein